MASWLTHIRIAEQIKKNIKAIDEKYLVLGSIAPNLYINKEGKNLNVDDVLEFFSNGKNKKVRVKEFYELYMMPEKIIKKSDQTRSFLWGYYFNLISENYWEYEYHNYSNKKEQISELVEEMIALDFVFLNEYGNEIIQKIDSISVKFDFITGMDTSYIYSFKSQLVNFYNNESFLLDREFKYINSEKLNSYISKSTKECISKLLIGQ